MARSFVKFFSKPIRRLKPIDRPAEEANDLHTVAEK
jgi:hypothetical protein